ncbi:DHH family phosphoesterase [Candidatus Berkelbacteria bacterium]|nr:DHH family phosphoesterase [Candidatus Berkelbacteria bacterium]
MRSRTGGQTILNTVTQSLQSAERILLVTHEHPDGDALGTTLALAHALRALGKHVTATCTDTVPVPFQFLPGIETLQRDCLLGTYDRIVILDCGDLKRTGMPHRIRDVARYRQRIINIDHHQRNDLHKLASLNYVDYAASSAAELVYPLIERLGVRFTPPIATCLLTGLYNDTGGFKHSNTSPTVLHQAAQLMAAGGDLAAISEHLANYRSVPSLRIWGVALSRLHYHPALRLIVSAITEADLAMCDAEPEDLAGCVNLLNSVPEARATMLLCELPNGRIKASVRTEDDSVDVATIAALFGGGGITRAAGFSFPGRLVRSATGWQILAPGEVFTLRFPLALPAPSYAGVAER